MRFATFRAVLLPALVLSFVSSLAAAADVDGDGMNHIVDPNDYEHRFDLSTAFTHTCLIDDNGLQCWGSNWKSASDIPEFEFPGPFEDPIEVAAGEDVTCATNAQGDLACWGDMLFAPFMLPAEDGPALRGVTAGDGFACAIGGEIGFLSCFGEVPEGTPALEGVLKVRAGTRHACALTGEGLQCWGAPGAGTVPEGLDATAHFALGYDHTCAIDAAGTVQCWGLGDQGQTSPPPLSNPYLIAAGRRLSCAADDSGVTCWGLTENGDPMPAAPALTNVYQLDVGEGHACALSDEGLTCWVADGSFSAHSGAAVTDELFGVEQVAHNTDQVCGRSEEGVFCFGPDLATASPPPLTNPDLAGSTWGAVCADTDTGPACWGRDTNMQLAPGLIPGATTAADISLSSASMATLIDDGFDVLPFIWGDTGTAGFPPYTPGEVWSDIWIGDAVVCAMVDGALGCWQQANPLYVPISSAEHVAFGNMGMCAISAGVPVCWGDTPETTAAWEAVTPAMTGVTELLMNPEFACAMNTSAVQCWSPVFGPQIVPPLSNPTALSIAFNTFCALDDTGLVCWGDLPSNNPLPSLSNPVLLDGGDAWGQTTCGIDDRGIVCWGLYPYRQAFFAQRPGFNDSDGDGTPDDIDGEPFDPNRITVNLPPLAAAYALDEVTEDSPLSVDGFGSFDLDGEIIQWAWDADDSNGVSFVPADAYGDLAQLTFAEPGAYTITLQVMDNGGATGTDTISVTVLADRDGDTVPDRDDAFPDSASAWTDRDGDGYPDSCSTAQACLDDGLTLDPSLDDFDNDGIPTAEDEDDTVDTAPPSVTAAGDISLIATGSETEVDLLQQSAPVASDFPATVLSAVPNTADNATTVTLPSGRHQIDWCATDTAGNTACDTQTVDITPLVGFNTQTQTTAEGATVSILVSLSGDPLAYPVTIPVLYREDMSSAVHPDDHDGITTVLNILADDPEDDLPANTARLQFNTVDDGVTGEADETVVWQLVTSQGEDTLSGAALGAEASLTHTVTITEENVAPTVALISADEVVLDGPTATGAITITDPNNHDEYLVSWYLDGELIASGINLTEIDYDISEISAGEHTLRVTVLDNGDPAREGEDSATVNFAKPPLAFLEDASGGAGLAWLALSAAGWLRRKARR